MSFRKEKKYKVNIFEMYEIKQNLLLKGMKQIYPDRTINSCYFDTYAFSLFHESEEGTLPRKKVRVRWYNNDLNLSKEIKISSIEGRFKQIEKIGKFNSEDEIYKLKYFDSKYGNLIPSLTVRYERAYYEIENIRITFDKNISYQRSVSKILPIINDKENVIEVKVSIDTDDDYIEKLILFSTSRFSKYTRGILTFENILKDI